MEIEYENEEQPFEDELYDELDDDWIKLIEEEEKEYTSFYRESNDMIKIFFTYVNSFNKIYYIKKEIVPLNEGYLNREILINLLKKNKIHRNINHDIISVLQYNIDLEPENVIKYLKQNEFDKENFLTIRSDFNDIYWLIRSICEYDISITYDDDIGHLIYLASRYVISDYAEWIFDNRDDI